MGFPFCISEIIPFKFIAYLFSATYLTCNELHEVSCTANKFKKIATTFFRSILSKATINLIGFK